MARALKCHSELLLGSFFQPPFHLLCMLLTALPLLKSLLNSTKTKKTLIKKNEFIS